MSLQLGHIIPLHSKNFQSRALGQRDDLGRVLDDGLPFHLDKLLHGAVRVVVKKLLFVRRQILPKPHQGADYLELLPDKKVPVHLADDEVPVDLAKLLAEVAGLLLGEQLNDLRCLERLKLSGACDSN